MEKPSKAASKGNKIFKYLSKATSFTIGTSTNPEIRPFHHHNAHKAFSGTIVPEEARRRKKPGSAFHRGQDDGADDEPTSPKVSCIGQIKHKNSKCKNNFKAARRPPPAPATKTNAKKPASAMKRMFTRKVRPGGSRRLEERGEAGPEAARGPPTLGMMKRYASGRETLAGFDWRKEEAMMSDDEEWEEEEEVIIPHSAPILVGGGGVVAVEPKKEVNLWKRRTSQPPVPLQVSSA